MGDRWSISRPIRRGQAVPTAAVLLLAEQLPEAPQGSPLAARQAAALLLADTQQAQAVGQAAHRRAFGMGLRQEIPTARRPAAAPSALGRRRVRWGFRSGH